MKAKCILVGLFLLVLSVTAWSQEAAAPVTPPTTGKIVLMLTVNLVSTFPAGEIFSCALDATGIDSSGLTFIDSEQIAATKAGSTLTCMVTVNYSWALATPTVDHMLIEYRILGAVGAAGLPIRLAEHGVASMTVPASGKITSYTLSTAI